MFGDHAFETVRAQTRAACALEMSSNPRSLALALVVQVGALCDVLQSASEVTVDLQGVETERLLREMGAVQLYLIRLADICRIDLPAAVVQKIAKNRCKYPSEQCKGLAHKSDHYGTGNGVVNSNEIGTGTGTRKGAPVGFGEGSTPPARSDTFSAHTWEELRAEHWVFCQERDWAQYHTPRNLALALVGEVGELCEIFQWKGEISGELTGWADEEIRHLGEELSDVQLYLIRLADVCHLDLPSAVLRQVQGSRAGSTQVTWGEPWLWLGAFVVGLSSVALVAQRWK